MTIDAITQIHMQLIDLISAANNVVETHDSGVLQMAIPHDSTAIERLREALK